MRKALLMAALALPMGTKGGPTARLIDRENDDPARLAPRAVIEMSLERIDKTSRRSVPRTLSPWSDVTWKANKGLISERYSDSRYEEADGWRGKRAFLRSYNTDWMLQQWERERWVASLSPAEKYDLLMGIVHGGLADGIGAFLDDTLGGGATFPGWWGLCEGSAVSSVFYPEPVRPVVLRSEAYGLDIPFYAPDIKGLATMLWSRFNTTLDLPESGLQCRKGRGDSCFDSNPASFHAAVHHFLDLAPGILVGEVDPSPVVWNFPLVAYSERYFRPDGGSGGPAAGSLREAAVPVSSWAADPRRSRRSPGTAYIVGVRMDISYAVNQAQLPPYEGSLKRKVNTRALVYELELDRDFGMLGGEWVSGEHPDLLWAVPKGTVPDSPGEQGLSPGGGENGVIPRAWRDAARASAQRLTPLRRVVEILVRRSAER